MDLDKSLVIHVYRMILTDIFNGIYSYHSKLPSLEGLCSIYNVGRNTIRSALLLLEENGYVTLQRGARATVVFHHDDEKLHYKYKQTLLDSKQMCKDVFETMRIILPSIGVQCLENASPDQVNELLNSINSFNVDNIQNEEELVRQLFSIYSNGFSLLNNPILDDLLETLLNSIYHPPFTKNKNTNTSKYMQRIQNVLKIMVKTSKLGQSIIVKNMIAGLCLSYSKILQQYIDKECKGMIVENQQKFVWSVYHEEDYLYMQVVFRVVYDINNHVYKYGDLLPSISQISLKYNVSDRTSRRALNALKEYKIIEVVNGVGSKVIVKQLPNYKKLTKHPEIRGNIKKYLYASRLLLMMNTSVLPQVIRNQSIKQLQDLVIHLRNQDYFSIAVFLDYIYKQTNQCLYTIYKEIGKSRMWGLFANMFANIANSQTDALKEQLLDSLERKDITLIEEITNTLISLSIETVS